MAAGLGYRVSAALCILLLAPACADNPLLAFDGTWQGDCAIPSDTLPISLMLSYQGSGGTLKGSHESGTIDLEQDRLDLTALFVSADGFPSCGGSPDLEVSGTVEDPAEDATGDVEFLGCGALNSHENTLYGFCEINRYDVEKDKRATSIGWFFLNRMSD
jgi:hypothetical protein